MSAPLGQLRDHGYIERQLCIVALPPALIGDLGRSLTKRVRLLLVIVPAVLLTACTPKWLNPSGARALRYEDIPEVFYYTDSQRTNAYLYFRLPGLIVTGMSTYSRWDAGAEKFSVGFGVVRDTPENQSLYPMDTQLGCWRDGDYWVKRFDINVGRHGPTDDLFKRCRFLVLTSEPVFKRDIDIQRSILSPVVRKSKAQRFSSTGSVSAMPPTSHENSHAGPLRHGGYTATC
jgi:hypothetical protein